MFNFIKQTLAIILFEVDKLLKRPNVFSGFLKSFPKGKDWISVFGGGVEKIRFNPKNNPTFWVKYRPDGELQKRRGLETFQCVSASALNIIETQVDYMSHLVNNDFKGGEHLSEAEKNEIKYIVNIFTEFGLINEKGQCNASDRYLAKVSGTTKRGNTQNKVAEAIRKYGLVPESLYPWPENVSTWAKYYEPVPKEIIDRGKEILKYVKFNHEWVNPVYMTRMLEFAPLQTSLYANPPIKNGIYQRTEKPRNHAVQLDNFKQFEWKGIFDSYIPFDKKMAWNFNFGWGKIITVRKKEIEYNEIELKKLINRGFKYIIRSRKNGEIYEILPDKLKYISAVDWNNNAVREAASKGKLIGISEKDYKNLFK